MHGKKSDRVKKRDTQGFSFPISKEEFAQLLVRPEEAMQVLVEKASWRNFAIVFLACLGVSLLSTVFFNLTGLGAGIWADIIGSLGSAVFLAAVFPVIYYSAFVLGGKGKIEKLLFLLATANLLTTLVSIIPNIIVRLVLAGVPEKISLAVCLAGLLSVGVIAYYVFLCTLALKKSMGLGPVRSVVAFSIAYMVVGAIALSIILTMPNFTYVKPSCGSTGV